MSIQYFAIINNQNLTLAHKGNTFFSHTQELHFIS
jgi:hypothetical protein